MNTQGAALLKDAYRKKDSSKSLAPNKPGVWKLFENGRLMTLGEAKGKGGLRKRFSDLYRGKPGGTAGKKEITKNNRDQVVVWWRQCSKGECARLRKCIEESLGAGEKLPWFHRRGKPGG